MDELIRGLREEGEHQSRGRFEVDWKRRWEILGGHLLNPDKVLLKFVQACVGAGSSYLTVERHPWGYRLEFDGSFPTPEGDLMLGLHTAVNTAFTRAHLVAPKMELEVSSTEWRLQPGSGAEACVLELYGGKLGVELDRLHERCYRLPLALSGSRDPFPRVHAEYRHPGKGRWLGLPPSEAALLIEDEPDPDYPEMALGLTGASQLELHLSHRGVVQRMEREWPVGAAAIVSAEHLNTDLSGFKAVEDATLDELLDMLARETRRLLDELRRRYPGVPPEMRLEALKMGY